MSADREVLLTCPEVERLCRLSRSTIYKTIRDGTFPAPVKISARAVRQNDRALAPALERRDEVQEEGIVPIFQRWDTVGETPKFVVSQIETIRPNLGGKGGLATAKSKVLRLLSGFLKCGAANVLPRQRSAVSWPWSIMFIRASA